jgi:hypothetical protein
MSHERPASGCHDLGFADGYPIDELGEVALEDYARALTLAQEAQALRGEAAVRVSGVHLCALRTRPAPTVARDIEDFARDLALRRAGGLGWE